MNQLLPLTIKGHCKIIDDLGNTLLDKDNAIHPQNMSRIIARALANESNSTISRIAFGNGGTVMNEAYTITYQTPNDGQPPDGQTWDSRLYNEVYSEIIDEGNLSSNPLLGTDPGSSSPSGTRPGGGSRPSNDPSSIPHVSGPGVHSSEQGLVSQVKITCVLNATEPFGQFITDDLSPVEYSESSFSFDEIGLFSAGTTAADTNGSQDINVGNKIAADNTTLLGNTTYGFRISVDGGALQTISFTTPASGSGTLGEITYGDLCQALNTSLWGANPLPGNTKVSITNTDPVYTTIVDAQTYGFLRFISGGLPGPSSSVAITNEVSWAGPGMWLVSSLNSPTGGIIQTGVQGKAAGVQNDPVNPETERERLLTHLIFSPILKAANRELTITYTLNIAVARTV